MRLTPDPARERDGSTRPLGFLGLAHPLVRRALDRVGNVQFGTDGGPLDCRVSAVRHDGPEPGLLATFLGRVASDRGREFERVVGVRAGKAGEPVALVDPVEWAPMAAADRAVPTAGLWERVFAEWGDAQRGA